MNREEFNEMERRLDNWRSVVCNQAGRRRCGSAEGRYMPHWGDERRSPSNVVDELDAWKIEHAWKSMQMPHCRWLIKLHYIHNMPAHGVIRWVLKRTGYSIKRWQYRGELFRAVAMLKDGLDMRVSNDYHSIQQFESLSCFG